MGIFDIIISANRNLLRNKVRTFLTVLAIFVGSFTICLNVAINSGVDKFIDEQTESLGGEDYIMIIAKDSANMMSSMMTSGDPVEYNPNQVSAALSKEQIEKLKTLDGIDGDNVYIAKQVAVDYITSQYTDKKYTINIGSMPPGDFRIALTAGTLPDRDAKDYQITLEPGYPKVLGLGSDEEAIGKIVTIAYIDPNTKKVTNYEAKVVGVQARGVVAVNGSVVNPALEEAIFKEATKNYPPEYAEQAHLVQARYDNSNYSEDEIKQILEDNGFYGITVSDMMGTIRTFFDIIMVVFTIFGGIALLAAAIGIINTLLMSVEERTREIGLDKALGMSSAKIFLSFSLEAIALGFWGSVFGIGVAVLVGHSANVALHQPGALLEVFPTFNLFDFTLNNMLPIMLIVMAIAFVAGTAPAWKAAHKNPIDALRYE